MTKQFQKSGWTSLSQAQYRQVFLVAKENAGRQFSCTTILACADHHQNAIADLILGWELQIVGKSGRTHATDILCGLCKWNY